MADANDVVVHEGLEGVIAFSTEIAEPDKEGSALRYRGVDIEDLVGMRVTFGDVWALLVDGRFGDPLAPAAQQQQPKAVRALEDAARAGFSHAQVLLTRQHEQAASRAAAARASAPV